MATASGIEMPGYDILVGRGWIDGIGMIALDRATAHRYAVITDETVGALYADRVVESFRGQAPLVLRVPPGETTKTRETWAALTDQLLAAGVGRDSALIALGGGVIGDLTGFVAATYMRGIPYVQVPTTLLAMLDASIGGKTGVDTPAGKNLVGAFHPPRAVLVDLDVLATLPAAHRRAGAAEAIKHGVIADAEYFDRTTAALPTVLDDPASAAMRDLVWRSVEIKADVVRRDEREGGLRKILNFGHTLGHAIESLSGYALPHGEAIAIGMTLEARLAERLEIAEKGTAERVREAVDRAGLPSRIPQPLEAHAILAAARADKKARGGEIEYALPERIGTMAGSDRGWSVRAPDAEVLAVLRDG